MSGVHAVAPSAKSGLAGVFRSWLRAGSSATPQTSAGPPSDGGVPDARPFFPVRVLVVDDNPVNLMVVSALMESRGLVPLLATNGAEAVALACEVQLDLILMDLQMPVLGGLAAAAEIRRSESSASRPAVPVVAYTGHSPGAAILAAHGINGSLANPCDAQALEDCLVRWCPSYRPGRAAHEVWRDRAHASAA